MRKYSAEDKLRMVKLILEAKHSITSVSTGEGIHPTTLEEWIRNYQSMGSETFYNKGWTKRTSAEKEIAVQEYLSGLGSLRDICKKHKISSTRTLRQWIALYNGHKELKFHTGGSRMTKGRKTTYEERIVFVKECIENGCNYTEIAQKHQVGYQQIYTWVQKYKKYGEDALKDRQGRHKKDYKPQTEEERLRLENATLKRQLYLSQMEIDVLKKLQELERGNR